MGGPEEHFRSFCAIWADTMPTNASGTPGEDLDKPKDIIRSIVKDVNGDMTSYSRQNLELSFRLFTMNENKFLAQ